MTQDGKLTPKAWGEVRKTFLLAAAIGDYVSEMCQALSNRCRELAEEGEEQLASEPDE